MRRKRWRGRSVLGLGRGRGGVLRVKKDDDTGSTLRSCHYRQTEILKNERANCISIIIYYLSYIERVML